MNFKLSNRINTKYILAILIGIQCFFLYYKFWAIPFSHDELSALYRCSFETFNDLLLQGIKIDGHPAGVQIFLWKYLQLVGLNEFLIKLPFLLAAQISLILLFKITVKLFDQYSAILCCILFITSEYFLGQQSLARPYSLGLMFNLGLFYSLLLAKEKTEKIVLIYSIAAILATCSYYTHYFSFLQSIVIWLVFPLVYKSKNLLHYSIAGIVSLLLFLPHIAITRYQLSLGGLGWLQKPDINFIKDFYSNLFNANFFYVFVALLGFALSFKNLKLSFKNYILILLVYLLPMVVIGVYSIVKAPVLQGPALYFSTPFLLIAIGSILYSNSQNSNRKIPKYSNQIKAVIIGLFLFLGVFSLLINRNYFERRYFQPIKAFIQESEKYLAMNPDEDVKIIWYGNSNYFNLYKKLMHSNLAVVFTDTMKEMQFTTENTIICNNLPAAWMHKIAYNFPCYMDHKYNFLFEFLIFSKKECNSSYISTINTIEILSDANVEWSNSKTIILSSQQNIYEEFMPIVDSNLVKNELIYEVYTDTTRLWAASIPIQKDAIISIKLKDVFGEKYKNNKNTIKFFLKNDIKRKAYSIRFLHLRRPDNPYEYSGILKY